MKKRRQEVLTAVLFNLFFQKLANFVEGVCSVDPLVHGIGNLHGRSFHGGFSFYIITLFLLYVDIADVDVFSSIFDVTCR